MSTSSQNKQSQELNTDSAETSLRDRSVLQQYAALFRSKGVLPLVVSMIIARMPTGCLTMLLVLFVGVRYNAAIAGTASAAWTMGLALLSPYLGRLVDRGFGPRTLQVTALLEALVMVVLIVCTTMGAPAFVIFLCAAATGALNPPVSGTTRSLWRVLVSKELLPIAYSFEILLIDALYVSGPLVASLFIAFGVPELGMIFTTACLVVGSFILSVSEPVKRYAQLGKETYGEKGASAGEANDVNKTADACEGEVDAADANTDASTDVNANQAAATANADSPKHVSLLKMPSVWAVLIACMGAMMYSGWMETLIPLHFESLGQAAQGSIAISLWSVGSIIGVLAFVRIQNKFSRFNLAGQLVIFTAFYLIPTTAVAILANAGYIILCVAMTLVGLLVSPCTNLHYQVGGECAPPQQHAEMFSWLNTATSAGISLGALLAGNAIELIGSDASFSIPFVFVVLSLAASLVLQRVEKHKEQ